MKFATIGTNFITEWFLEAAKHCNNFELAAVYSRERQKGGEFAAKYGCTTVYTTLEELSNDKNIEAVYIASPNTLHHSQAIQLMQAKKHIFCEKPVAVNLREFSEMLEVAEQNGVLLLEAMRCVYSENLEALRSALKEIGTVRSVYLSFCQYSSRYDRFKAGESINTFNPRFGGGALTDLGCYTITLALLLFGKPKKITATASKLQNGLDCAGTLLMEYEGFSVTNAYSKVSNTQNLSEIAGEKGLIRIDKCGYVNGLYLQKNGEETRRLDSEEQLPDMVFELRKSIELSKEPEKAKPYQQLSKELLEITDEARRQCGIVFAADK